MNKSRLKVDKLIGLHRRRMRYEHLGQLVFCTGFGCTPIVYAKWFGGPDCMRHLLHATPAVLLLLCNMLQATSGLCIKAYQCAYSMSSVCFHGHLVLLSFHSSFIPLRILWLVALSLSTVVPNLGGIPPRGEFGHLGGGGDEQLSKAIQHLFGLKIH